MLHDATRELHAKPREPQPATAPDRDRRAGGSRYQPHVSAVGGPVGFERHAPRPTRGRCEAAERHHDSWYLLARADTHRHRDQQARRLPLRARTGDPRSGRSALAGRADLRDGGSCHTVDLPEGLPHGRRRAELGGVGSSSVEGCPPAAARSDWRQIDGMALGRQRADQRPAGRATYVPHGPGVDGQRRTVGTFLHQARSRHPPTACRSGCAADRPRATRLYQEGSPHPERCSCEQGIHRGHRGRRGGAR